MAQLVKNSPAMSRRHRRWGFNPWVGTIPRRRKWQLTPVFLPEKSHGQRSLAGCNAWGHESRNHKMGIVYPYPSEEIWTKLYNLRHFLI